jgi:hypothetical protein
MTPYSTPSFSSSRAHFESLASILAGDEAAHFDRGELERRIQVGGRELMQDYTLQAQ